MNKWRSPTAEKIYFNHPSIKVRSAGTSSKARRTVSINDIIWSDIIIVMESKHKQRLKSNYQSELNDKDVFVLDIPDDYQFMDPELIDILEGSIDPIITGLNPKK
jgi:predicted protein tyrosine phosphatase